MSRQTMKLNITEAQRASLENGYHLSVQAPSSALQSRWLTCLQDALKNDHSLVVTIEDGVLSGGFGEKVARFYGDSDMKVSCYGIAKKFLDRYNYADVLKANRMTAPQIAEDIISMIK